MYGLSGAFVLSIIKFKNLYIEITNIGVKIISAQRISLDSAKEP